MKLSLLPPLSLIILAACASAPAGEFPSLARRPAESPAPPAPAPAAPPAADATLTARIAALVDEAHKGDDAFASAVAGAERRVSAASGAAAGSEAWIDAQQALSGIEATRAASVGALASMDSLLVERLDAIAAGKAQGGEAELRAAQAEIGAIVDRQTARMDALKGKLKAG